MSTGHALPQVKVSAEALLAQGKTDEAFDLFLAALEAVLVKNRDLELLIAKLRRERLGRTSERIDPGQLTLLFETMQEEAAGPEPVDAEAEAREDAALTAEIESAETAGAGPPARARKGGPGWATRGVERRVHRVEVPKPQRACPGCGREMRTLGEDVTRRLEYVPAHFVEHEYHLDK
jgi:hypothetical protein